jgi:hypothetical protein
MQALLLLDQDRWILLHRSLQLRVGHLPRSCQWEHVGRAIRRAELQVVDAAFAIRTLVASAPPSRRRMRRSTASRDRAQRPNLPQHGNFYKCSHIRYGSSHLDSAVILHLVACEMCQIATCSRRDLANALQTRSPHHRLR